MKAELTRQLRGDEGVKAQAYQDHLGLSLDPFGKVAAFSTGHPS
jgi:hypothetical protein